MTDNMRDKIWADDCSTFTTKPDNVDGVIEYTRSDNHVVIPREELERLIAEEENFENTTSDPFALHEHKGAGKAYKKLLKEY